MLFALFVAEEHLQRLLPKQWRDLAGEAAAAILGCKCDSLPLAVARHILRCQIAKQVSRRRGQNTSLGTPNMTVKGQQNESSGVEKGQGVKREPRSRGRAQADGFCTLERGTTRERGGRAYVGVFGLARGVSPGQREACIGMLMQQCRQSCTLRRPCQSTQSRSPPFRMSRMEG